MGLCLRKNMQRLIAAVFFMIVLSFTCQTFDSGTYASEIKRQFKILVIHSYHKGFTWTDAFHEGFVSNVKKTGLDIEIYVEYLDWKRFPDQQRLDQMLVSMIEKYKSTKFDVIATSDDAALKAALRFREAKADTVMIPIVFTGVNREGAKSLAGGKPEVAGILETFDAEGTTQIALDINKNLRKIFVVFDNSESGLTTGKLAMEGIRKVAPEIEILPLNERSHQEIIHIAQRAGSNCAFLLTTYYTDKQGNSVDFEEFCRQLSEKSRIPIYSLYDFHMGSGAIGGSMASSYLSGTLAAKTVLEILNGEKTTNMGFLDTKITKVVFDYKQLEKFHIGIGQLPAGSNIINKPFSFYQEYRTIVLMTIGTILVLILFILILAFYIGRIKRIKKQLEASELQYKLVVNAANDGIWDWDIVKNTYWFSDRWFDMMGYDKTNNNQVDMEGIVHPEDFDRMWEARWKYLEQGTGHYECELRLRAGDGSYKWIHTRGKALFDQNGKPVRMAGAHEDISELREYQAMLQYSAEHDSLTGLYNRRYLNEEIGRHLNEMSSGKCVEAMYFIDIDNFKLINDTMGHFSGDRLLCIVAERLAQCSNEDSILFRLGGDEFIYYLKNQTDKSSFDDLAHRLHRCLSEPVIVSDKHINVTLSIGIAVFPEDGLDVGSLLRCADIAMYRAKKSGKNMFQYYNDYMNREVHERVSIEHEMRYGLAHNEFSIAYQPLVDVKSMEIQGLEALVRWNNHELGKVTPMKFIPIAEETGFINQLGDWIMKEACSFIKNFNTHHSTRIRININISVIQIMQEGFVEHLLEYLDILELKPQLVELEITESIIMESPELIISKIRRLRELGIGIAMDDFGIGYSSLAYLKNIPITTLKIDKSFIDRIKKRSQQNELADSIIELGHKIGLVTIAEGVEDEEQYEFLRTNNCDMIQGYYFYKPMSPAELKLRLNEGNMKFLQ